MPAAAGYPMARLRPMRQGARSTVSRAAKSPPQFALIGKPVRRLDSLAKSTGSAVFGIDVDRPGHAECRDQDGAFVYRRRRGGPQRGAHPANAGRACCGADCGCGCRQRRGRLAASGAHSAGAR